MLFKKRDQRGNVGRSRAVQWRGACDEKEKLSVAMWRKTFLGQGLPGEGRSTGRGWWGGAK